MSITVIVACAVAIAIFIVVVLFAMLAVSARESRREEEREDRYGLPPTSTRIWIDGEPYTYQPRYLYHAPRHNRGSLYDDLYLSQYERAKR